MPASKKKKVLGKNKSIKRVVAVSTELDPKMIESALAIEDLDLLRFYGLYVKNNLNAKAAYWEMKPEVTENTAQAMGSIYLNRLTQSNPDLVLNLYGLDAHKYTEQLKQGLEATKWNDYTGEREADHKTRLPYHDKLGRLLKLEQKQQESTVNFFQFIKEQKNLYNI